MGTFMRKGADANTRLLSSDIKRHTVSAPTTVVISGPSPAQGARLGDHDAGGGGPQGANGLPGPKHSSFNAVIKPSSVLFAGGRFLNRTLAVAKVFAACGGPTSPCVGPSAAFNAMSCPSVVEKNLDGLYANSQRPDYGHSIGSLEGAGCANFVPSDNGTCGVLRPEQLLAARRDVRRPARAFFRETRSLTPRASIAAIPQPRAIKAQPWSEDKPPFAVIRTQLAADLGRPAGAAGLFVLLTGRTYASQNCLIRRPWKAAEGERRVGLALAPLRAGRCSGLADALNVIDCSQDKAGTLVPLLCQLTHVFTVCSGRNSRYG
jgi:hypothetical protein